MKVFHGSFIGVNLPDIKYFRHNLDFGKGFYVTPIREQANNWAKRFKKRKGKSVVSIYELTIDELDTNYHIKKFETYSEEWLEYILSCRSGNNNNHYDVVIGGVANDKVFNTVELYFDGLIDKIEALNRLKYEKPNIQICILNQEIIDKYLLFERSEIII